MKRSLAMQVQDYLASRQKNRRRTIIMRCLAVLVAFATAYALIIPAITKSNELLCGLEAHTHTEDCWAVELSAPEPELACTAGAGGEIVIHTHDASCYNSEGVLVCPLEEVELHTHDADCFQEHRVLVCEESQSLGHTHDSSCYAYERGGLVCGLEEGSGHVHTDSCYITQRSDVPVCGLVEDEGHTHTEACYTYLPGSTPACGLEEGEEVMDADGNVTVHYHVLACYPEEKVLTCGEVEREGHVHTDACRPVETILACGLEESESHVHTDSCYEWIQTLSCPEEEADAGHVHTDECYEVTEELVCGLPELVLHTHSESCYTYIETEDGGEPERVLTCGLPEVIVHQHTDACFHTPEGGLVETRVLVCGMEEHVHTEECYVDIIPKEEDIYFCGQIEHIHTEACYFESGALRCTLAEHVHTADCLIPPEDGEDAGEMEEIEDFEDIEEIEDFEDAEETEGIEDAGEAEDPGDLEEAGDIEEPQEPEGVLLEDESFVYEGDAFVATYWISGFARLTGAPEPPDEQMEVALEEVEIPMAPRPGSLYKARALSAMIPAPEEPAEPGPDDAAGAPEEEAVPDWGFSAALPEEPADSGREDGAGLLDPSMVEFSVEEVFGGEAYEEIRTRMEEMLDTDSLLVPIQVMQITASVNGKQLDLTGCEITVEVHPSDMLARSLDNTGISTMDLDDPPAEEEEDQPGMSVTLLDGSGALATRVYDSGELEGGTLPSMSMTCSASNSGMILYAAAATVVVNPKFTVQFYANLSVPESTTGTSGTTLSFIDTSKATGLGGLPKNGNTSPKTISLGLDLNSDGTIGTIVFHTSVTEIYKSETKEFNPKMGDGLNIDYLNSLRDNGHYEAKALWVLKAEKDPASKNADDWNVYPITGNAAEVAFTNNPDLAGQTDEYGRSYIVVDENTVMRLVYDPEEGTHAFQSTFYDYDISTGPKTATAMNTKRGGINSYLPETQKEGEDARFAFGNGNMGTDFQDDTWNGNLINRSNKSGSTFKTFQGMALGMVSGMKDGDVVFSSGITGPSIGLFGSKNGTGKTVYGSWSLNFNRHGDTFTLSSVAMDDNRTVASGLEQFSHPGIYDGVKNKTMIWTNHFWPLDQKWLDGQTTILDPMFGAATNQPTRSDGPVAPSDDGKNHNSYFGMTYSVDFDLVEEYIGPLEYYFYGDDDLWVFLDGTLVCDLGGLHISVGEYVDLWDYIDGGREGHAKGQHTLTIFYTERGASGSTCWMQFTLPQISQIYNEPYDPDQAGLIVSKEVVGAMGDAADTAFPFTLELSGIYNNYEVRIIDADGADITAESEITDKNGNPLPLQTATDDDGKTRRVKHVSAGSYSFSLRSGEKLEVIGLPIGAGYQVEEKWSDCVTTVSVNGEEAVETVLVSGTIGGSVVDGKDRIETVTIAYTNTFGYVLPATGGGGIGQYTWAGALLAAAACFWYKRRYLQRGGEE